MAGKAKRMEHRDTKTEVRRLAHYLDKELTLADLDAASERDLLRLEGLLHHWHQIAVTKLRNRKG